MWLSDLSVRRPVLATVVNALLVVFGVLALQTISVREYPDIDAPVVSVSTNYPGASAAVVETKITQVLEDRIAGIEGIRSISSSSRDGRSNITVEFQLSRDIDAAANDVRDRVARTLGNLPEEADPPEISKADVDANPILWLVLISDRLSPLELSDYAERQLVDRLGTIEGVSGIRIGGQRRPAMRVWLDPRALAARNLTAADVEAALRAQNVERPAGRLESQQREFTLRTQRAFATAKDFEDLVISRGADAFPVRLREVARVEISPADQRSLFRANGAQAVGLGIIKQSKANTLSVAHDVKAWVGQMQGELPDGMQLKVNYDSSLFIEASLREVIIALVVASLLVVGVIYVFLGDLRATLIPAATVPISLTASFIFLAAFGFSINILTLLALVLAIGLVVDDAIVVVENNHRHVMLGEPPLLAAFRGTREVGFAVLATTIVLIAVFAPVGLLQGNVGRLFREFALSLSAAVLCSMIVALTLSPVLGAVLLRRAEHEGRMAHMIGAHWERVANRYRAWLSVLIDRPLIAVAVLVGLLLGSALLYSVVPREFTPPEDRGQFFLQVTGPEGATYDYTLRHMTAIEGILLERLGKGEIDRMIVRIPGFGGADDVNNGTVMVSMTDWEERDRTTEAAAAEVSAIAGAMPGVRVNVVQRSGFGGGLGQPVQMVLGGPTYEELAQWRDRMLARIARENPQLLRLDSDYKETKPAMEIEMDLKRAADLGVPPEEVGRTLETLLGSRRVTTYIEGGEEYDVLLQANAGERADPSDLGIIHVRGSGGRLIPLSNLIRTRELSAAPSYNRYDRMRSITITAGLEPGYPLGKAVEYLEQAAAAELPSHARISWKGESRELRESGSALLLSFGLALLVVYLVLAAQFEGFIHPLVIMTSVPLAVFGALLALGVFGYTLNIYSQIGVIMLIGLAAKNGILIVEFANQRRDAGLPFREALVDAATIRLRPILMTSVATVAGSVPLVLASGAGAESRGNLGIVVFWGVLFATFLTLFVVPAFYALLGRRSGSPGRTAEELRVQQESWDTGEVNK